MRKDKQQSSFINIGSSSLLVIFLILCLVTFAILSVSSAKSDHSFSERLAGHKTEYYKASARAELIVGKIDETLYGLAESGGPAGSQGVAQGGDTAENTDTVDTPQNAEDYFAAVAKTFDGMLVDGITLSCATVADDLFISYEVPIGEKQMLNVRLLVTDYTKDDTYYRTAAWQVVPFGTWEGDESLDLMPVTQ